MSFKLNPISENLPWRAGRLAKHDATEVDAITGMATL